MDFDSFDDDTNFGKKVEGDLPPPPKPPKKRIVRDGDAFDDILALFNKLRNNTLWFNLGNATGFNKCNDVFDYGLWGLKHGFFALLASLPFIILYSVMSFHEHMWNIANVPLAFAKTWIVLTSIVVALYIAMRSDDWNFRDRIRTSKGKVMNWLGFQALWHIYIFVGVVLVKIICYL